MQTRIFRSVFGRTDFSRVVFFEPPDFVADFVAGFFLLIFVGKVPRKILQENPRQYPPNFIQQKSPTIFCRGARPRILRGHEDFSENFSSEIENFKRDGIVRSHKRKFPRFFLSFLPEFFPEFCSEFSPNFLRNFRASFRGKRRPEKIHQKIPGISQCKIPRQIRKKKHKNVSGERAK